ncbi:MAG TPA: transketolase C-terminal domain-containing protein [Actinomycetota bacterium]
MGAATRDAFGEAILEAGGDERIVVLTGDLKDSTRVEAFAERYPERFVECGIAESNMLGVAAGLALSGKVPWACSFSTFVAGRFETIRVSIAFQEANARIVGTHSGIGVGEDGYSQMAFEDMGALRTLPNMAILNPADAEETRQVVRYLVDHEGPAFLRLTRQGVQDVSPEGYRFEFGKAVRYRDGTDVAILGTGATVGEAMKAAGLLAADGVEARVIGVPTLKPFDEETVIAAAADCGALVTVEDHSAFCGLGSATAETLAAHGSGVPLRVIGLRTFGESGTPAELYEKYGLTGDRVAAEVGEFLASIG